MAIALGANVVVPIRQAPDLGASSTSYGTALSLQYVLGDWDFYAQLGLTDMTRSQLPYVNIGAVCRWGG